MADVRFSQAANAYQDALRAAEKIISKAGSNTGPEESAPTVMGQSFSEMVGSALKSAENAGYRSEAVSDNALVGKAGLSDVITAVASAENALQTVVAVRDKVISAYQEIIRMPI